MWCTCGAREIATMRSSFPQLQEPCVLRFRRHDACVRRLGHSCPRNFRRCAVGWQDCGPPTAIDGRLPCNRPQVLTGRCAVQVPVCQGVPGHMPMCLQDVMPMEHCAPSKKALLTGTLCPNTAAIRMMAYHSPGTLCPWNSMHYATNTPNPKNAMPPEDTCPQIVMRLPDHGPRALRPRDTVPPEHYAPEHDAPEPLSRRKICPQTTVIPRSLRPPEGFALRTLLFSRRGVSGA